MLRNIDNWDKIPTETYKNILEEGKIRYNEMLSQSENITSKVIQTILVNSATVAWFTKFLFDNKFHGRNIIVVLFACFTLFVYIWLVEILFPRKIVLKGTAPKDALKNEQDFSGDEGGDNYNNDQKIKIYYYHQVYRYQNRIENLKIIYNNRTIKYRYGLIFSLALFIYMVLVTLTLTL